MPQELFEPERYELQEGPAYQFEMTRRDFVAAAAGGLFITVSGIARAQRGGGDTKLGARLHIGEDGIVTVLSGKVEVGQGSRTEIAMAAAEELRLPLDQVRVTLADTDLTPNDGITAGSRSTPSTIPAVRRAGAAARELILEAAAKQWQADRASLQLRDGQVKGANGRSFSYADLAKSAELAVALKESLPPDTALTPVKDWKILGSGHFRTDAREMVTGTHRYPADIVRPGMWYGSVLRPPTYGATLVSLNASPQPGIALVHEGSFAGCAAPTSFAARKGVEALAAAAQWKTSEHPSSEQLFAYLKEHAEANGEGRRRPREQSRGSVQQGMADAKQRVRAVYQVPYIQHAPMEPRAAVAEWQDGRVTIWTGTQNPFGVRDQVAQAFHLQPERVRIIVPDTGGGFGGKHSGEVAIEAARLAREAGHPVSLRWTRAEEFMWAYFRPAGLFEIEAGLDSSGRITAWDYTNYNAGTAAMETPYRVENVRTRFVYCDSPLREGSYRGIAATANHFARESFMDELAEAAGSDPLAFRLAHLDNDRLRNVLQKVASEFGFLERRKSHQPNRGVGLAGGTEKGSYVAACAEVQVDSNGMPHVLEFAMAFECGAILNPDNLLSQVEGSIIQGLGGALTEAIEFENGKLKNGLFSKYKVPRFKDVPPLKVHLLNRPDLPPAGAGETPIVAVAPAVAAAVHHATGKRPRSMPVRGTATA